MKTNIEITIKKENRNGNLFSRHITLDLQEKNNNVGQLIQTLLPYVSSNMQRLETVKNELYYGSQLMKENETFYEEQISLLPELYKDLLYKDTDERIWMPTTINIPTQGMVFANGSSKTDWNWAAVKAVPVSEEEKSKYPIPGKKGKYYEYRMDMTTIQHFPERGFMDALSYIGVLPE